MTIRFAWASYEAPWSVELTSVEVDGESHPELLDTARHRLHLDQVDTWEITQVGVMVSTAEPTPPGVGDLHALAILSCPKTNVRAPYAFESTGADGAVFEGTISLPRTVVAGAAEMTVEVAATVEGRRRLVGLTKPWSVIVEADSAPTPPGKPPFDTAWIDFGAPDAPEVARHQRDAYAVMDLLGPKPTLLLNEGVDGLKNLLLAGTARNERRRLREIIGTAVARQATATLVRAAAAEVVADDDATEPQIPSDPLHRQALEAVAGSMPTVGSADEFYEGLLEAERGSAVDRARLWAEIDAAVDRLTGHSSAVASVVAEAKYV